MKFSLNLSGFFVFRHPSSANQPGFYSQYRDLNSMHNRSPTIHKFLKHSRGVNLEISHYTDMSPVLTYWCVSHYITYRSNILETPHFYLYLHPLKVLPDMHNYVIYHQKIITSFTLSRIDLYLWIDLKNK